MKVNKGLLVRLLPPPFSSRMGHTRIIFSLLFLYPIYFMCTCKLVKAAGPLFALAFHFWLGIGKCKWRITHEGRSLLCLFFSALHFMWQFSRNLQPKEEWANAFTSYVGMTENLEKLRVWILIHLDYEKWIRKEGACIVVVVAAHGPASLFPTGVLEMSWRKSRVVRVPQSVTTVSFYEKDTLTQNI